MKRSLHIYENNAEALINVAEMHFEVSSRCNLRCSYCYAQPEAGTSLRFMPAEIACRYVDLTFRKSCARQISVVFHGGEPLLQSIEWFETVMEHALKLARLSRKQVRFLMQSNCTLLNDEKLELIRRYSIQVGTSVDGPPTVGDLSRGLTRKTLQNIERLREVNCFGGAICVINLHNFHRMEEILSFFEENSILRVSANICYACGRGATLAPLRADQIFEAYRGIFRYLERTKGLGVVEMNMAAKMSRFVCPPSFKDFEELLICSHPFCGAAITTIMCDTEGNLYPCGCSNRNPTYLLGHVDRVSDADFSLAAKRLHMKKADSLVKCRNCIAAAICEFGCPALEYFDKATPKAACAANKRLYSYFDFQPRESILNIVNNVRRIKSGTHENEYESIRQYND